MKNLFSNPVMYFLLILFLGLLGYNCFIGTCNLVERTVTSIFVQNQDAKSLQQSAVDSAKGASYEHLPKTK